MSKYHINPKTGEPGLCSASIRECPIGGGEAEHYETEGDARRAYELMQEARSLTLAAKKKVSRSVLMTQAFQGITDALGKLEERRGKRAEVDARLAAEPDKRHRLMNQKLQESVRAIEDYQKKYLLAQKKRLEEKSANAPMFYGSKYPQSYVDAWATWRDLDEQPEGTHVLVAYTKGRPGSFKTELKTFVKNNNDEWVQRTGDGENDWVIVDSRAVSDAVRKHQGQDGVEKLYLYSRPPGSLPAGTKMNQFDDIQKYPAYASITNNGNRYMKLSEDLWREDKKTRSFDSHGYMTDKDIFGLPGDKIAL